MYCIYLKLIRISLLEEKNIYLFNDEYVKKIMY